MSNELIVYLVGAFATFCLTMATAEQEVSRRLPLALGYAVIWPFALFIVLMAA